MYWLNLISNRVDDKQVHIVVKSKLAMHDKSLFLCSKLASCARNVRSSSFGKSQGRGGPYCAHIVHTVHTDTLTVQYVALSEEGRTKEAISMTTGMVSSLARAPLRTYVQ